MKKYRYLIALFFLVFLLYLVLSNCSHKADVKIGQQAPSFALPDINGNEVNFSDYKGKVILIRFWTLECTACEKEMPELDNLYRIHKDKGLAILAVNVRQLKEPVTRFAEDNHLSYPVLLDTYSKIASLYGIRGVPVSFIISKDGKVTEKIYGEVDKETIESLMVKLL